MGALAGRHVRRSMDLYREPRLLFAKPERPQYPNTKPNRFIRGALQLRHAPSALGITRRQLLGRRPYQHQWDRESQNIAAELPNWSHGLLPREQVPVSEIQL